MKTDTEDTNQ